MVPRPPLLYLIIPSLSFDILGHPSYPKSLMAAAHGLSSCHPGWGPGEWLTQLARPYLAPDPGLLQILGGLRDPSGRGEYDGDSGFVFSEDVCQELQHQHLRRRAFLSDPFSGEDFPHPYWLVLDCFPQAYFSEF